MAVVTHGSFDEGPIVLALPPIFEGLIPTGVQTETDPIFTAWDKSTGINIDISQITDFSSTLNDFITVSDLNSININTSGSVIASNISGNNTGDQSLYGLVPYTGATSNVDLGTHSISVASVTIDNYPLIATDAATKGYVDTVVTIGVGEGGTLTMAHNNTTDKEGGSGGHYYHLGESTYNSLIDVITANDPTSDIVPTGLVVVSPSPGISNGMAYVTLTWNAITTDTFDHYVIEYKRSSFTYYTPIITTSNTITIDNLLAGVSYVFRIASVNKAGISSDFSSTLVVAMPNDTTAPATVTGVTATGAIQAVLLRWTHNTDADLASYNIYRYITNTSASAVLVGNITGNVYMDNGLVKDTTYYYWLKAVDISGNLSTAYSTVASATTRNVEKTDIVNIGADQVIIQGVTTLASWTSPGVTTIDGDKITTGTITLQKLNFTPITGGNIVASINASLEGIQIEADNFSVSGATVFTAKVGGSFTSANTLPRIRIFPSTDIGIEVRDNLDHNVFTANVGGTNVGDVIIGNWAGGSGIYYDKSANGGLGTTTFAGTIQASAGLIGGWTIASYGILVDSGYDFSSVGMCTGDWKDAPGAEYKGVAIYAGSSYANRANAPFKLMSDGELIVSGLSISDVAGTNEGSYTDCPITMVDEFGNIIKSSIHEKEGGNEIIVNNRTFKIEHTGGVNSGSLVLPCMSTGDRGYYLVPENGMMIYNTSTNRFNGFANGTWYYFNCTAGA
jgi:hypothetical protein